MVTMITSWGNWFDELPPSSTQDLPNAFSSSKNMTTQLLFMFMAFLLATAVMWWMIWSGLLFRMHIRQNSRDWNTNQFSHLPKKILNTPHTLMHNLTCTHNKNAVCASHATALESLVLPHPSGLSRRMKVSVARMADIGVDWGNWWSKGRVVMIVSVQCFSWELKEFC